MDSLILIVILIFVPLGSIYITKRLIEIYHIRSGHILARLIAPNNQLISVWMKKEGDMLKYKTQYYPLPTEPGYAVFSGILGNNIEFYFDESTRRPINFKFDSVVTEEQQTKEDGTVETVHKTHLLRQSPSRIDKSILDNIYKIGEVHGKLSAVQGQNYMLIILCGIGILILIAAWPLIRGG